MSNATLAEPAAKEAEDLTQIIEEATPSHFLAMSVNSRMWVEKSIRMAVFNHFCRLGYGEDDSYMLSMAAAESATNATRHSSEIRVFSYVKDDKTYLDIVDEGKGIPQERMRLASQRSVKDVTLERHRAGEKTDWSGFGLGMIMSYFSCRSYRKDGYHVFSIEVPPKSPLSER